MAIPSQPSVLNMAWASNAAADKNVIPDTMQVSDMSNDAAASWDMGFPSQTSLSQGQGGYYVAREDVNGALNALSQFALYAQSGSVYVWSASVDYGTGAHVRGSDGIEYIAVANSGPGVASAVNPTTDTDYSAWKPYLRSIADFIYPVGSIYMSMNNTSPALLFGGTWLQISGRFLLASKSGTYNPGNTGGNTNGLHSLSVNELPSHNHTASAANAGSHKHTATNASAGAHTHTISITAGAQSAGAHTHSVSKPAQSISVTTGSNGAHTHTVNFPKTTITTTSAGAHTHNRGTMNITGTLVGDNELIETATGCFEDLGSVSGKGAGNDNVARKLKFNAINSWEGSTSSNGGHTHNITIAKTEMTTASAGAHTHSVSISVPAQTLTAASAGAHTHNLSGTTASAGSHTHTITVDNAGSHTHTMTVGNTGENTPVNIMPPYFVVNVWRRTA